MAIFLHTKLQQLPIVGTVSISELKEIVAFICGETTKGIIEVREEMKKWSDDELKEYLTPNETFSLAPLAAARALQMQNGLKALGSRASWKTIDSYLVLGYPQYFFGPRDNNALIIRTGKSRWELYYISRFILVE